MMKMRTRNAPARIAIGTTSHQETGIAQCMKYQSAAYGTSVLVICHSARTVEGCWYCATICRQTAGPTVGLLLGSLIMAAVIQLGSPYRTVAVGQPITAQFFQLLLLQNSRNVHNA